MSPPPPPPPPIYLGNADYETNQRNQLISKSMESINYFQRMIMYQSIPSLTITPDDPRGFACSHCLGVQDFESEKFSTVFQRQVQELLDLFQRNWRQQVFLCCFMSTFAKTVDVYCIFDNVDHFGHLDHFDKIFRSSKSHFANSRSSLKF